MKFPVHRREPSHCLCHHLGHQDVGRPPFWIVAPLLLWKLFYCWEENPIQKLITTNVFPSLRKDPFHFKILPDLMQRKWLNQEVRLGETRVIECKKRRGPQQLFVEQRALKFMQKRMLLGIRGTESQFMQTRTNVHQARKQSLQRKTIT